MLSAKDVLLIATVALHVGCGRGDERRGLPPASAWKPPPAESSQLESDRGEPADRESGDPHAGLDMGGADPHAGIDMGGAGDPHAGLDMGRAGDPHAGLGGDHDPHANVDMGDDMAGLEAPDPDRPIDESKFLRGSIRAKPDVAAGVKPGSVLFLSARPVDPNTGEILGAPVAVAKLTVDKLPAPFELTERDMMVGGTRFEGDVLISARVDGDGEARTKEPGDVEGRLRARIPAKGLDLVLDTPLR